MVRKTIGYVELEWTCPQCGTRNPGSRKTCASCGAAMGEADQFALPPEQELVSEPEKLEAAKRAADVHCPYCRARNPAGSAQCTQCGASLTDARAREAGKVLGAHRPGPAPEVRCPFCGETNPAAARKCRKCGGSLARPQGAAEPAAKEAPAGRKGLRIGVLVLVALAIVAAGVFLLLGSRTTEVYAVVEAVHWERTVPILAQVPVEHGAWQEDVPPGAELGACEPRLHHTQPDPTPGAEEVCGTPYVMDKGTGYGEVAQDCEYRIYRPWCTYHTLEWAVVNTLVAQGDDLQPRWPEVSLQPGQQAGEERRESYEVLFREEDGTKTYRHHPHSVEEFTRFVPGSPWRLEVGGLGGVHVLGPAQ